MSREPSLPLPSHPQRYAQSTPSLNALRCPCCLRARPESPGKTLMPTHQVTLTPSPHHQCPDAGAGRWEGLLRPSCPLTSLTWRFNHLPSPYSPFPRQNQGEGLCHNQLSVGLPGHWTLYPLLLRSQRYTCLCLVCSSGPSLTKYSGGCYSLKHLAWTS